jgi:anti-sigma regulatory factor (Ser/Thr protein kinase)
MDKKIGQAVRDFIIENIELFPETVSQEAAKKFNISRQAINRHLLLLREQGILDSQGATRNKRYFLKTQVEKNFKIPVSLRTAEDQVWREYVGPLVKNAKENIVNLCHYGVTEMFNNILDHAQASVGAIQFSMDEKKIRIIIKDDGVGIFNKIAKEKNLLDVRHAILELAKGKLTTDPQAHTGEGIFFTSRMFDRFAILSGALYFSCSMSGEWLWEDKEKTVQGTAVFLELARETNRTPKEIFDQYAAANDFGFTRTRFPVGLAGYGDENLVSRSQAKRLLSGLDRFHEVVLDFRGVRSIGQAFADEIFRVYKNDHSGVLLSWTGAEPDIESMIQHVMRPGKSQ